MSMLFFDGSVWCGRETQIVLLYVCVQTIASLHVVYFCP